MTKYIALAAITLDGKIARNSSHMTDWTSKEDKEFLHKELKKGDVILVGNNTYKTAKKPRAKRKCVVFTRAVRTTKRVNDRLLYCNPEHTDLKKLMRTLGYKRTHILGGAETYDFCLKKHIFDELYLTIEPLVFGKGISIFNKKQKNSAFVLVSVKKLNAQGSILLHYKRRI